MKEKKKPLMAAEWVFTLMIGFNFKGHFHLNEIQPNDAEFRSFFFLSSF